MADIKLYTGLMGSGKTYEVASLLIYDAIKQGRRVISNIAGLNQDEYYRLLQLEGYDIDKLGRIVTVTHEQVLNPAFWLTDKKSSEFLTKIFSRSSDEATKVDLELCIQAGDLVALDEIWRFWDGFNRSDSEGKKRPDSVMNFMRMLRHFAHPVTGVTCDLALLTQDVLDVARSVRNVISETYRMTKLTAVGLSNRYRVDVYTRTKIVKEPLRSFQRSYNPDFFALYQSHSQKVEGGADAREINIDKRGNLLGGKLFLLAIPLLLILGGFAIYYVWGYFHPKPKVLNNAQSSVTGLPNTQNQGHTQGQPVAPQSEWHIQGYYTKNGVLNVVLSNSNGAYRYLTSPDIAINGLDLKTVVAGLSVNNWLEKNQQNTVLAK